ncbi:MAG: PAS domain S-box protein [Verrucomicrobia bacterium]|nr:PAS domain S-box protein [Verrucomicrobiota bacterium]
MTASSPSSRPSAQRGHPRQRLWFVWAIVMVAAGTLVRLGLLEMLGTRATYITFFPAVILAALYGGLPAGLLATVLSAAAADYFWLEPFGFGISHSADWLSIGIFLLSGGLISGVVEAMHRARDRAKTAEAQAQVAAERARTEEQLRQLSVAVEAAANGIAITDREGKILWINPAFTQLTGYTLDEAVGGNLRVLKSGHHPPEFYQQIWATILRGEVWHGELINKRKDGLLYPEEMTITPVVASGGEITRFIAVKQDITERKRAEEALQKAKDELETRVQERTAELKRANAYNRSLIEVSLDPLVTIGPDGKITDVNAATEAATGCARAALVGTDFSDYFTEPANARAGYQQVFREGFVRDYPLELRHRDGRVSPVLYNASVYRDQSGNVTGVFAAARDITAQKLAELALRSKTEELDRFFSVSLDLLCIADADGFFRRLNPAWEQVLGYSREELTTRRFLDFVHPDDVAPTLEAVDQLAAQKEVINFVNRYRCRDGSYRWFEWRAAPAGNLIYAAARDITERKRTEEELRRSNEELEHFAYVASHDLQEPLRTMSSFSQLLADRYRGRLDSDADEFITFLVDGAKRMQVLINDLLDFSRIGTRGSPFAPVECEAVLRAAQDNLEVAIAESGAVVTHDPLPALTADAAQLTRLFQNLIGNAIKFRRPQEAPRIHVSAVRQGGAWRLSVRDNGIGIEPQYFERIFVIFQRLHDRDKYPGTGIGLAICKKIVERHHGRMCVESKPGQGSTFHFTIPDEKEIHEQP